MRAARINPLGLDWRGFLVAVDDRGTVIGCGQIKAHSDGVRELASIVVEEKWRGRGVARAVVDSLMGGVGPPLWLTCRSSLTGLYERFGFRETAADDDMPAHFRRLRRAARAFGLLVGSGEHLAVMVWDGQGQQPPRSEGPCSGE